jgi:hypothetical protein
MVLSNNGLIPERTPGLPVTLFKASETWDVLRFKRANLESENFGENNSKMLSGESFFLFFI